MVINGLEDLKKMCELNPKNKGRRIDSCMIKLCQSLSYHLDKNLEIVACCCGHGKYPMSLIIKHKINNRLFDMGIVYPLEIFSRTLIKRKKRFYKRDKQGYYYIPEVLQNENRKN